MTQPVRALTTQSDGPPSLEPTRWKERPDTLQVVLKHTNEHNNNTLKEGSVEKREEADKRSVRLGVRKDYENTEKALFKTGCAVSI